MKSYGLILFFLLMSFIALSQQSDYYEFFEHSSLFSYDDFIPIDSTSSYILQRGGLYKLRGNTKEAIYQSSYSSSRNKVLYLEKDTLIFMYNYFDSDIGSEAMTLIRIGEDSIELINPVFDSGINSQLNIYPFDFVIDSSEQILMSSFSGVFYVNFDLDTIKISDNRLDQLIKNNRHDLFEYSRNSISKVNPDFSTSLIMNTESDIKKILLDEDQFYILFDNFIEVYTNNFTATNIRIESDSEYGKILDFAINDQREIFIVTENEGKLSLTLKYDDVNNNFEHIYVEQIDDITYTKIKAIGGRIFCIGNYLASPIIKSQPASLTLVNSRPDISIENIEVTYDSTQTTVNTYDGPLTITNYQNDLNYSIMNNGTDTVSIFSLASYHYPLSNSTRFFRLNYSIHDTIAQGQIYTGFEEYHSSSKSLFTFRVLGANFLPNSNTKTNFLAPTELIASQQNPQFGKIKANIFPNPANDNIQIQCNEEITLLKIYNQIGQLITTKINDNNIQNLFIQNLNPGVYIVEYWNKTRDKVGIQKLLKE